MSSETPTKQRRPAKRLSIILISLLAFILVALAAYRLYLYLNGPAIVTSSHTSQQVVDTSPAPRKNLQGKYFSVSYQQEFSNLADTLEQNSVALEQYQLVDSTPGKIVKVVITIKSGANAVIADDSSYRHRRDRPDDYTAEQTNQAGAVHHYFYGLTTPESTVFMNNGSQTAIIAVTTSNSQVDTKAILHELVSTFSWREPTVR